MCRLAKPKPRRECAPGFDSLCFRQSLVASHGILCSAAAATVDVVSQAQPDTAYEFSLQEEGNAVLSRMPASRQLQHLAPPIRLQPGHDDPHHHGDPIQ